MTLDFFYPSSARSVGSDSRSTVQSIRLRFRRKAEPTWSGRWSIPFYRSQFCALFRFTSIFHEWIRWCQSFNKLSCRNCSNGFSSSGRFAIQPAATCRELTILLRHSLLFFSRNSSTTVTSRFVPLHRTLLTRYWNREFRHRLLARKQSKDCRSR